MKRDTVIKVLSLALGLTIGIVLIGKIFYELSYDTEYPDSDRIYKIMTHFHRGDGAFEFDQISGGVAPGFYAEIPGVEAATRTTWHGGILTDESGQKYNVEGFAADISFFDVFKQKILTGDPKTVLSDPSKIMISENFAQILGGTDNVIGKVLTDEWNPQQSFIIEGVFKDFKPNGSITPDIIYSLNVIDERSRQNWEGNDRYYGYVKLLPGIEPGSLNDAIHAMQAKHQDLDQYSKSGIELWYYLTSLKDIHLKLYKIQNALIILAIVVFLILTISLMNYILVVVSGLIKKSKEMGIRKCYGAGKSTIYFQLLKESTWQLFLALLIAGILIFAGKNLIREMTGYSFSELLVTQSIIAIIGVIILVLIISVIVPASAYVRIPVTIAIKGYQNTSRKWKIGLLGIQIAINVFIITFLIIIGVQYHKVNNFNPGYETDHILTANYYIKDETQFQKIADELKQNPNVEEVGVSGSLLYRGSSGNNVAPIDVVDETEIINIVDLMGATPETFDIFNLNFLQGGKPENPQEIAVSQAFVEKMSKLRDWSDGAVGKQFRLSGHNNSIYTITGVYEDVLIGNLLQSDARASLWPIIDFEDGYGSQIIIKCNSISPSLISELQKIIRKATNSENIYLNVYKENIRQSYEESMKIRKVLLIGGFGSLLIALMGLIGFLHDEAERRKKELAIRKINGASSKDLFKLFYSSIIKLSLASAIVACCGAFIMGRHWLQQFSERITLSPFIFICGTLFILIIVTVVVIINSYKVVTANPTKSLYNE